MKTIEKKYYVCEICGKTAQDEEKIKQCQESHTDMSEAGIECSYRKGKEFPQEVIFVFEDGTKAGYVYNYHTTKDNKTLTFGA